ncbi:MAG TPA: alpha/beta hydrolase [Gammaproteobacteria bacterium]|nr:alpha/beta hydrolase [Gammaproteobacteria bacterium]
MGIKIFSQLILVYILATAVVYFLSDYSIFPAPASSYQTLPDLVKIKTADGKSISAIYLPNPEAKYTLIYSHGNAEDLGTIYSTLQSFNAMHLSVIGYDYAGYGSSDGKASEKATYADIQAVYDYLIKQHNVQPDHIILFGRSLGTGPSVELAAKQPVGGLILESGFTSAYRVVTHYPVFMFDKYNNISKLQKIHVPILFIHGLQDAVVPFWHGKALFDAYNGPKQSYWLPNAGHNDIDANETLYKNVIYAYVAMLPQYATLAQN